MVIDTLYVSLYMYCDIQYYISISAMIYDYISAVVYSYVVRLRLSTNTITFSSNVSSNVVSNVK